GATYIRADRLAEGMVPGDEARILQIGSSFYWIPQAIEFDGQRDITASGSVQITSQDGRSREYAAERMEMREILTFFMTELQGVIRLSLFYFGLIIISALFSYRQLYYLQNSANRIIRNIRTQVFGQIHRLPIRFFDNLPAGKV